MNTHRNARLTLVRRAEMIRDITQRGFSASVAAQSHGVTAPTAHAYYAGLGVQIKHLLTDNGAAFRSRDFAQVCKELVIGHRFTRPYRPQTNGKAERFIQSALRQWAYGFTYQNSNERTAALDHWNHH